MTPIGVGEAFLLLQLGKQVRKRAALRYPPSNCSQGDRRHEISRVDGKRNGA